MNLPKGNQLGLIAQDMEKVFPELINNVTGNASQNHESKEPLRTSGFKVVNYVSLIPVLISGIQEQQKLIDEQAKTNASLQQQIDALKSKTGTATGISSSNPAMEGFALQQNVPNPFSNETLIGYQLPAQVSNASLVVYDLSGKQITSLPLEKNASSITITSEKLAAGIYIYSVMADGKILDSKRMVVAQK